MPGLSGNCGTWIESTRATLASNIKVGSRALFDSISDGGDSSGSRFMLPLGEYAGDSRLKIIIFPSDLNFVELMANYRDRLRLLLFCFA